VVLHQNTLGSLGVNPICDDEQLKAISSRVVILLNDIVQLRISHCMEGENVPPR
jgi:hypothetical protein